MGIVNERRIGIAAMGDPKWRRTENNAIWVYQDELEELAEANEVRDEASKANVRLDGSQDESEVAAVPATEPVKIEEAAELRRSQRRPCRTPFSPWLYEPP
jgi:hypothetical protein